jgi:Family of unknown function (DUF6428)
MSASDNTESATALAAYGAPAPFTDPADLTIGELLGFLADHTEKRLIFHCEDRPIRAGYHITEVKAGEFAALDCGANPEAWTEMFIQLWDIDEGDRTHMPVGKFSAIIKKVSEHVSLDAGAKLTFEVSDGAHAMQLHRAALPRIDGDTIRVDLAPRPASCKPRDRWLEGQRETVACRTASKAAACCG